MSAPRLIPYAGKERAPQREGQFYGKAFMLTLWRGGLDTADIAKRCRCSEAYVYNELAVLRASGLGCSA